MMNTILIMLVVFLAMQLLLGPQRQAQQREAPKPVNALTQAKAIAKKDSADVANLKKQFDIIHPSGPLVSVTRWWEDLTGTRPPESADIADVWLLYAQALEAQGYRPRSDRNSLLENAEQEYRNFKKELPTSYGLLVKPGKLPELGVELDKRFQSSVGYQVIDFLVGLTGGIPWLSYALAPFLLALGVRILTWPLSNASFRSMRKVTALAPLANKLKEHYEGQELLAKQQELYKKSGVNPLAGCIPMAIQFPFLWYMYSAMRAYRFHFQHGVFLWINPAMGHASHGYIAANLGQHDNILLALYAVSMFVSQRMMVMDPATAQQQGKTSMFMTAGISIMMFAWQLPSAFVFYWLSFNVLQTVQQMWVNKQPMPTFDVELPELLDGNNGKGKGLPKLHKPKTGPGAGAKKRRR